jgi:TPR repeat protein
MAEASASVNYPTEYSLKRRFHPSEYLSVVAGAPMFGLCRFIVVSVVLTTGAICTHRAQAEPRHMVMRDPGGMYALGVMLDEGLGVEMDERRAFEWYHRAAKLGHSESMNRLGILYLQGRGVPRNTLSARSWFRLAAANGSLTAFNNIALLYYYGVGVHQSYSKAVRVLRISANRGNADAQNKLGLMYESGLGVAPDRRKASDLFLKSAAQGYSPAMVNLGLMITQENNNDARDVLPCPLIDVPNAATGIQRALLNLPDIGSREPTPATGTGQHPLVGHECAVLVNLPRLSVSR